MRSIHRWGMVRPGLTTLRPSDGTTTSFAWRCDHRATWLTHRKERTLAYTRAKAAAYTKFTLGLWNVPLKFLRDRKTRKRCRLRSPAGYHSHVRLAVNHHGS